MDENGARYRPSDSRGHYESWFLRANHPQKPVAFWIRYTIFAPRGRPHDAEGELWAIAFDGECQHHIAVHRSFPRGDWRCSPQGLDVAAGSATLASDRALGCAQSQDHEIEWDLTFTGTHPPLFLLPARLYETGFPQAKSLVARPMARFAGHLVVDGSRWSVDNWVGSQNHNWGSRHTSRYAWGQVMGFDESGDTVLECATVRNRIGPLWTPWLTVVVVRHEGREHRLNGLGRAIRAGGRWTMMDREARWTLRSRNHDAAVEAEFVAPRSAFVDLTYRDPPGGTKRCHNTKIAACTLTIEPRRGPTTVLHTRHLGAFEILESTGR